MARLRVELAPGAEEEAREAFVWYGQRNEHAGDAFEAELTEVLESIAEASERAPHVESGVRRRLFRRFPYGVLYVIETERVVVLAVMHLRRRPGYWRHRTP